ncbi:hypothetical protein D1BOALGB6SA_1891 [Olavius sp. associated proteobacterium Delta 1]|nr:hypothetical protein D1BOALGB6SA_1891 [Olavius sp. associated proteobacterium Delta 1]
MKTFYSAEDIENLADRGQREIRVDENVVLTDMAKQTANILGIRITEKSSGSSPANFTPAAPQPPGKNRAFSGKPKGCQRRPSNKSAAGPGPSTGQSSQVVDKLVEKIKRIKGN